MEAIKKEGSWWASLLKSGLFNYNYAFLILHFGSTCINFRFVFLIAYFNLELCITEALLLFSAGSTEPVAAVGMSLCLGAFYFIVSRAFRAGVSSVAVLRAGGFDNYNGISIVCVRGFFMVVEKNESAFGAGSLIRSVL